MTIGHVLAGIRDGNFASRHEHGFLFVDVAPGSATYQRPLRPDEPRPATFVAVPPQEQPEEATAEAARDIADVVAEVEAPREELAPLAWTGTSVAEDDELPPLDDEEDSTPLPPRDAVRSAVALQRRRPLAA